MCAGALVVARVDRVVFGAADPKAGFGGSLGNLLQDPRLNHRVSLSAGVLAEECGDVLREFFREPVISGTAQWLRRDKSRSNCQSVHDRDDLIWTITPIRQLPLVISLPLNGV